MLSWSTVGMMKCLRGLVTGFKVASQFECARISVAEFCYANKRVKIIFELVMRENLSGLNKT